MTVCLYGWPVCTGCTCARVRACVHGSGGGGASHLRCSLDVVCGAWLPAGSAAMPAGGCRCAMDAVCSLASMRAQLGYVAAAPILCEACAAQSSEPASVTCNMTLASGGFDCSRHYTGPHGGQGTRSRGMLCTLLCAAGRGAHCRSAKEPSACAVGSSSTIMHRVDLCVECSLPTAEARVGASAAVTACAPHALACLTCTRWPAAMPADKRERPACTHRRRYSQVPSLRTKARAPIIMPQFLNGPLASRQRALPEPFTAMHAAGCNRYIGTQRCY